jgi:hypothetical protein
MMRLPLVVALLLVLPVSILLGEEGMWRIDRLPRQELEVRYGVALGPEALALLRHAPVRILAGGSGGTGTFASANGLILTNHHVALDCIRTSTLAEDSENYIKTGYTAASLSEELPCKRFLVQVEREATDVTAKLEAAVTPEMTVEQIQAARERVRSEIERNCQSEKGDDYACDVVDFGSGALSLLVVYEQFQDVRLVYAPEVSLGYFGGDEMNFRFPRYVSDVSILRAYAGKDGAHRDYHEENVPHRPSHYAKVNLDGVNEGDFALVSGFPGNTNRHRMSFSADYNLRRGIPEIISDLTLELELLQKYAAMKEAYDVLLKSRIFGLANTLKYQKDVLAALRANDVVADRREREREFVDFLESDPSAKAEYGGVLEAQAKVYAEDVEAYDPLDSALQWIQKSTVVSFASGLYEFALAREIPSDADREPQFQERNWPFVRQALLDDDPLIDELEEDFLARGFELALSLPQGQRIDAVEKLASRVGRDHRGLARAVLAGTKVADRAEREKLADAPVETFRVSGDSALSFARDLEPSLEAARKRTRILNEKLFRNRARFARGIAAWKKSDLYYDANFTLRVTYGAVRGYQSRSGDAVPFTTYLDGLFQLSRERGNAGDFALPPALTKWRASVGEDRFQKDYAKIPVNFLTTHDSTGGNSGSAILDRNLRIVGLLFDGNEDSMASDWSYNGATGRSIATDIRFALFVAREVHGAGAIVDELINQETGQ